MITDSFVLLSCDCGTLFILFIGTPPRNSDLHLPGFLPLGLSSTVLGHGTRIPFLFGLRHLSLSSYSSIFFIDILVTFLPSQISLCVYGKIDIVSSLPFNA